jgi:hypothetical protein
MFVHDDVLFKKKYVIFLNQSRFVRFIKLQVDSLEAKKKKSE